MNIKKNKQTVNKKPTMALIVYNSSKVKKVQVLVQPSILPGSGVTFYFARK